MKDAAQIRILIRREHFKQLGEGFTAVNNQGQVILQCPMYLFVQGSLLLFEVGLIPIQIHPHLSDGDIRVSFGQQLFHRHQAGFIITVHRRWVKTQHRITKTFICLTYLQQLTDGCIINVGHKNLPDTGSLGAFYHLRQIIGKLFCKKMGMGINHHTFLFIKRQTKDFNSSFLSAGRLTPSSKASPFA